MTERAGQGQDVSSAHAFGRGILCAMMMVDVSWVDLR
jgi:hypothetical protein